MIAVDGIRSDHNEKSHTVSPAKGANPGWTSAFAEETTWRDEFSPRQRHREKPFPAILKACSRVHKQVA